MAAESGLLHFKAGRQNVLFNFVLTDNLIHPILKIRVE